MGKFEPFKVEDNPQIFDPMVQDDASVDSLESESSELGKKPDIDDDLFNLLEKLKHNPKNYKENKKNKNNDSEDDNNDEERKRTNKGSESDSDDEDSFSEEEAPQKERTLSRDGIKAMNLDRYKKNNELSAEDSFLRNFLIKAGRMKDDQEFAFQGGDEEDYHFDTSKLDLIHPTLSGESERKSNKGTSRRTTKEVERKKRQNDFLSIIKEKERLDELKGQKELEKKKDEKKAKALIKKNKTHEEEIQNKAKIDETKNSIEKKKNKEQNDSDSSVISSSSEDDDSNSYSSDDSEDNDMKKKESKEDINEESIDEEDLNDDTSDQDDEMEETNPEELENELMKDTSFNGDILDNIAKREEEISLQILELIRNLQQNYLKKKDKSPLARVRATTYEEFDAEVDTNAVCEEIFHPTFHPATKSKGELEIRQKIADLMTQYHGVYSEFANNSHKFKYKQIQKVNFGMNAKQILDCDNEDLEKVAPVDIYGKNINKIMKQKKKEKIENMKKLRSKEGMLKKRERENHDENDEKKEKKKRRYNFEQFEEDERTGHDSISDENWRGSQRDEHKKFERGFNRDGFRGNNSRFNNRGGRNYRSNNDRGFSRRDY